MNYTTGALKNKKDLRDIQLAQVQAPVTVPSKHITDISMLPVLNQRQIGACVGHAVATVMAYQNFRETGKYEYLSPRFIYALSKKIDGYAGQGTYPRVAGSVAVKNGCCSDFLLKNDTTLTNEEYIKVEPSDALSKEALIYKSGGYAFTSVDPQSIKQAIYLNGLIAMSIGCGTLSNKDIKPGTTNGSHYLAFYGYEDKGNDTILYYRNSWDTKWGDKGNGKLSMNDFKGFLFDAMVLTDIPNKLLEEARAKYKYFSEKEVVGLNPELVKLLDQAREIAGIPFKITSGYRDAKHNAEVGGVTDSAHTSGLAVDLLVKDTVSGGKILLALAQVGFKRFGFYADGHLHVDMDTTKTSPCYWIK